MVSNIHGSNKLYVVYLLLGMTVVITINNIPLSKSPDAETNIKLLSFPVSKMGKTKAKDTDTNMRQFDVNILNTTKPQDSETHMQPNPNKTTHLEISLYIQLQAFTKH